MLLKGLCSPKCLARRAAETRGMGKELLSRDASVFVIYSTSIFHLVLLMFIAFSWKSGFPNAFVLCVTVHL